MIILWIVFVFMFCVTLHDVWKMGKSELLYWDLIKAFLSRSDVNKDAVKTIKEKASIAASRAQFGVCYLLLLLVLAGMVLEGWITWCSGIGTFVGFAMLHYAGGEDLLFFILANYITLPEDWWMSRETVRYLGMRLPKELPWLSAPRIIGKITIKPYWITLFAGPDVKVGRFAIGVAVMLMIVTTISFL